MSDSTQFKNASDIKDFGISDLLEMSMVAFCQWASLGIGAFANVAVASSGAYGGQLSRLRRSEDKNYLGAQCWEGFRKDWVWESGVGYPVQPIQVSGVYVNGNFQPASGVGPYAHHIDYPNGRVVFDTPIPSGSIVTCEHSYRYVQWTTSDAPWWRDVQSNSLRIDDPHFLQAGSGAWAVPPERRVQLPAVVVEATTNSSRKPFMIGDSSSIVRQTVLFHILAETPSDKKKLFDLLTNQYDKRISGIDFNRLAAANDAPLDADGSPVASGLMYPDLIRPSGEGGYFWRQIRFVGSNGIGQQSDAPPYNATVAGIFEIDVP